MIGCRPTWWTANLLLSPDVADCVRRISTRVKFDEPTHGSVIARLSLRGHEHGTVCQSNCETLNYLSDNSLQAYIQLLTAAAPSDCFSCAGHKLTYLLTWDISDKESLQCKLSLSLMSQVAPVDGNF